MLSDNALAFDPPDADAVYASYCETCRRLGVEPESRERALDLMAEWLDALGRAMNTPKQTKH